MRSFLKKFLFIILPIICIGGCASIPQESVSLSQGIGKGLTDIHESNLKFVERYFEQKKQEINQHEKEAVDKFFSRIIAGLSDPQAPPLDKTALNKIKEKIEEIHSRGNEFRAELDKTKSLVIQRLENDYHTLIEANSTITSLLQSAVELDKANHEGLSSFKEITNGRVDLTEIEEIVDAHLIKFGKSAEQGKDLVVKAEEILKKVTEKEEN